MLAHGRRGRENRGGTWEGGGTWTHPCTIAAVPSCQSASTSAARAAGPARAWTVCAQLASASITTSISIAKRATTATSTRRAKPADNRHTAAHRKTSISISRRTRRGGRTRRRLGRAGRLTICPLSRALRRRKGVADCGVLPESRGALNGARGVLAEPVLRSTQMPFWLVAGLLCWVSRRGRFAFVRVSCVGVNGWCVVSAGEKFRNKAPERGAGCGVG